MVGAYFNYIWVLAIIYVILFVGVNGRGGYTICG